MKWAKQVSLFVLVVVVLTACTTPEHRNAFQNDSTWAMLPFQKVNDANPILKPIPEFLTVRFFNKKLRWEEKDVFNPAAVVRNGAVYLFYRAKIPLENTMALRE
jgi:hypothetical protein